MYKKRRTLHLFGGGNLLVEAAKVGIQKKVPVVIRTSERLVKIKNWVEKIEKLQIPILVGNSIAELSKKTPRIKPQDIGISFGAPWIFEKNWIRQWHGKLFNCHNRPLPKHRGAGGATWLILMQEKIGASTIHKIDEGVDTGPIVFQKTYKMPAKLNNPKSLDLFTEIKGKKFIQQTLPKLLNKNVPNKKQNDKNSTYWPRLSTQIHAWINWNWSGKAIKIFCEAFGEPYEGAKTMFGKSTIYIFKIKINKRNKLCFHPFQLGLIFQKDKRGRLYVSHHEGVICVEKWSTKSNTTPKVGDRLFTPNKYLEKSFSAKVQYLPNGKIKTN